MPVIMRGPIVCQLCVERYRKNKRKKLLMKFTGRGGVKEFLSTAFFVLPVP